MSYNISPGSAVSSITWRQRLGEAASVDCDESAITMSLASAGGGSWIKIESEGFVFDSADEILNLAVVAERLRAEHEKAGVFG